MRKIVLLLLTALLLTLITSFNAFATFKDTNEGISNENMILNLQREEGEIVAVLDGKQIIFDVKPIVMNGTTLVPARAIFEALGATVEWDNNTKTVVSKKGNTTIKLFIESNIMYVDGDSITLNHHAVIIDGRTLVPIRAISEAFGCLVGWDAKTRQVSIIADMRSYCMLYTLDGRAKSFHCSLAPAQLTVGWYEEPQAPIKICIDAGHYGKNNYSPVYQSYYESVMTWKLHLFLKKELEAYGFEVITTRADKNVDLDREIRGRKSEGCDLFISLHSNACEVESEDKVVVIPFQDLAWTDIDDKSRAIAQKLAPRVKEVMGVSSYQVFPRKDDEDNDRDENGVLDDEYYGVLFGARKVGTPGVIIEHGFHTNAKCAKWLSDDSNLEKLAKAEATVIAEFFGFKKIEN